MTDQINRITLPAQLTSTEVEGLYEETKKLADSNGSITLDGHLVEYVDFVGVQFLLACQTKLASHGEALLTNVSETLRQSLIDIGALQLAKLADANDVKAAAPE